MNTIHQLHYHVGQTTTDFDKNIDVDVHVVQNKVNLDVSYTEYEIENIPAYLTVEEAKQVVEHLQQAIALVEGGNLNE